MIGDNKIAIPWYKRNITRLSSDIINTNIENNLNLRIPKPKGTVTVPEPSPNPVRVPVTSPVPSTVTSPVIEPFPTLNPFPNPFPLPERKNPEDVNNPALPNPFPKGFPTPNFIPQPIFSENNDTSWRDNFITQIEVAAKLSGIAAASIYKFISEYDYEKQNASDFNRQAADEFGDVAAVALTVLIVGKSLIGLWGKRLGGVRNFMFSPPINTEDEYFKKYFGDNETEI